MQNKNKIQIIIFAIFALITINGALAYQFLNYPHDTYWNDTAEQGTSPTNYNWTLYSGSDFTYDTGWAWNGSKSIKAASGTARSIYVNLTNSNARSMDHLNVTLYLNTTGTSGNFFIKMSKLASSVGFDFGWWSGNGGNNWDSYDGSSWQDSGVPITTNTMHEITLEYNYTTKAYKWWVDGAVIRTGTAGFCGTSCPVGDQYSKLFWITTDASASTVYIDDVHAWNATIYASPSTTSNNVTFVSKSPADITSTNIVTLLGANVTYQVFNVNMTNPRVNYSLITAVSCAQYRNGSCVYYSNTNTTFTTILTNVTNGDFSNLTFGNFGENTVYPYTENLNFTQIASGTYNYSLTTSNQYLRDEIKNISATSNLSFYEIPVISTGVVQVYYYNSSYDFGSNPVTNGNVHEFCTLTSPTTYNHTHGGTGHQFCPFSINSSGYIGTVKVRDGGFLIRGNVQGVTVTIANLTARTNVTMLSTNSGNSWASQTGTIASHLHQFNTNDQFCILGFATIRGTLYNSTRTCDTLDFTPFPPEPPIVYTPNSTRTYGQYINITWEGAIPNYASTYIHQYNITLTNSDFTQNKSITILSNASRSYFWNTYDYNLSVNTPYRVAITANDSLGMKSTAYSDLFNVTTNGLLFFYAKSYNTSILSNFTIRTTNDTLSFSNTTSTTNGTLIVDIIRNYLYQSVVNSTGYAIANTTINATAAYNYYNFSLYRAQTIQLRFYDETTYALVNTTTITAELISNSSSYNYTTTNGTIFAEMLTPSTYTIRYGANNYSTRFYYLNIESQSFNALNLSMCPDYICSTVTIEVKDQFDNALEGATIRVLKYDILLNGYYLQEILSTNFEGKTQSNLQVNNEYYKFIIEYEGETVLFTQPTYVYGTTLTFVVTVGSTGFEDYFESGAITGYISNISSTTYGFTWSDADGTATQGCLYAYEMTDTDMTLYNSSCVSSAAGSTFVTVSNTSSYTLYGRVTKNGNTYTLDSTIVRYNEIFPTDNGIGLLAMILLIIAFAFTGLWNPTIAIVLASSVPFFLSIIGLVNISVGITGAVLVLGIIIAYAINR